MKFPLSLQGMKDALASIGIQSGDVILVHSDLRALGMPSSLSNPHELLSFYHKALADSIGPEGTLAVPAYFYEYARFGTPFDVENSPVSIPLGSFSRYLERLPGRVRSCNPLQSLAAIGPQAVALAGGTSLSGYGITSPWHRLRMLKGKILFIGVNIQPMTYIHYVEQQYGVPHQYCKIFTTPILRHGKQLQGHPISAVRYLDFDIEYDLSRIENILIEKGFLHIANVGKGTIRCVGAQEVYDTGIACLDKDPYFFLKHRPRFIPGKIPCDGITGQVPKNSKG